jgi:hypothetical protein
MAWRIRFLDCSLQRRHADRHHPSLSRWGVDRNQHDVCAPRSVKLIDRHHPSLSRWGVDRNQHDVFAPRLSGSSIATTRACLGGALIATSTASVHHVCQTHRSPPPELVSRLSDLDRCMAITDVSTAPGARDLLPTTYYQPRTLPARSDSCCQPKRSFFRVTRPR